MSRIRRWLRSLQGSSGEESEEDWRRKVAELEEAAKNASPGFQGTPLNRAGDICLKAGDRERALSFYGRAIDVLLEDEQREAARGVANKIIRIHPEAVRTLCTLTWLDLAAQHMATALLHLRDYVEAAQRAGQEERTRDQILEMARIAPQPEFVNAAADALDQLGFGDEAAEVRRWAREGGPPNALTDEAELVAHCVAAAVGSNRAPDPEDASEVEADEG